MYFILSFIVKEEFSYVKLKEYSSRYSRPILNILTLFSKKYKRIK